MTFLEKIKPHLISNDFLIQETVLHALHEFPNVPEEWTVELLKEAFRNKEKQSSILIYINNQTINEEAVKVLIENIPLMDPSKIHLALQLLDQIEPELALKYKEPLERFIKKDMWSLYELLVNGTESNVNTEYVKTLSELNHADSYQHELFMKAKKLAAYIVENGWSKEDEIDRIIQKELKDDWFSFDGILTVYQIGLLKLERYIPVLAGLLVRDDDILLEEVAAALIGFQTDEVVKEVKPYLNMAESNIFAASIVENIKSDYAVQVLREAYHDATEIDEQDIMIEALCHQFSGKALPEISSHMEKEYFSSLIDLEQTAYGYYSIIGEHHPDLESWRQAALASEMHFRNNSEQGTLLKGVPIKKENKVGRNDPCPCGSGKKYKKCCG